MSSTPADSATGVWMLGSNAVALEEKRLCMTVCNEATVGVCDTWAQGLQLHFWHAVHADPGCATEPAWPMPYVLAYDGRMQATQRILV
ncbi:hypothetical protein PLESTB_000194300 [Pleodorina starrii]|uniref:Uncharacterized protein n=1 Tax=Pleodorina starrii TaxID=330485 RepID=A0A9W6BBP4_9CHLO|nr:hypothetical protein PLESTM_000337000 [Pleodorina starrii]GLC49209.1 hypothetical protein PLESTB_000194300 [Pleodorina starrii]